MLALLLSTMALAEPAPPDRVVLADGQTLDGHVVPVEGGFLLTLPGGESITLSSAAVAAVLPGQGGSERPDERLSAAHDADDVPLPRTHPNRPYDRRGRLRDPFTEGELEGDPGDVHERIPGQLPYDPNRGRAILGPTAYPLGAGHGTLSQREIAATVVEVGITDGVDLSAGAVVPFLFTDYLRMAALGAKFSVRTGKMAAVGVGVEALFAFEGVLLTPHAMLTLGTERTHFTVGAGGTLSSDNSVTPVLFMASGQHRFGPQVGVVGELWVLTGDLPHGNGTMISPQAVARFYLGRWALDGGFVTLDGCFGGCMGGSVIPVPYFAAAWSWGRGRP
jgi:hypothetical protein